MLYYAIFYIVAIMNVMWKQLTFAWLTMNQWYNILKIVLYQTVLFKTNGGDYMQGSSIAESIGHEIKAIDHLMQRKMIMTASKSGLDKVTIMHGWIIGYLILNLDRDIYQKDIESEFAISRSTVTNILKLMEKKEYITRVSVKSDARLKKITLTDKGKQTGIILKKAVEENEKSFDKLLDNDEKETFLRLVKKLRYGLENNWHYIMEKEGVYILYDKNSGKTH